MCVLQLVLLGPTVAVIFSFFLCGGLSVGLFWFMNEIQSIQDSGVELKSGGLAENLLGVKLPKKIETGSDEEGKKEM